jgi:hypothetical protein
MFKNYIEIDEMQEKFEDTKEVIIIRKSRKNKQHNDPRLLVGFVLLDL